MATTDNLTKLIARSDPQTLEALQAAHPNAGDLVSVTVTRDAVAPLASPDDLTAARLDLLLKGLAPLRKELNEVKTVVTAKMRDAQRIKFGGAVIATLAGLVMAVTAAFQIDELWEKVVSAAFATVGGLVVILSDHIQSAPSGRRIASTEEYGKLSQMAVELYKLEARAERHHAFPLSNEELEQMIESMEGYAAQINNLQVK